MPVNKARLVAALVVASPHDGCRGQDYPGNKPINCRSFPRRRRHGHTSRGSSVNKLTETLKWVVVVDNKPGAGGNIGIDAVAKSPPDGYTIGLGQTSNLAINPTLYAKLPYDPLKDLVPIVLVADAPLVLVVPGQLAFQDSGRSGRSGKEEARRRDLRLARQWNRRASDG
jgi:hypothetical protein